jgi:hypothetical protein
MKMKSVAIIGAGQLGSRHLQALALYEDPLTIYLVDPVEASRNLSKERFSEVDQLHNKNIVEASNMENMPSIIDFAVIATTSTHRLLALEELFTRSEVKYLLLEKFLFPKEAEYSTALELISQYDVEVYVNCPRRLWPIYNKIKMDMSHDTNIKLIVKGSNWNLASNAIHFIDLFAFITGESELRIQTDHLNSELLSNKRKGFIEFSGTLEGNTSNNNHFSLTSTIDSVSTLTVQFESDQHKYSLHEGNGQINIYNLDKDEWFMEEFAVPKQSELTNFVFKELFETNYCNLVPFRESVKLHLTYLKSVNAFLNKNNKEGVIT